MNVVFPPYAVIMMPQIQPPVCSEYRYYRDKGVFKYPIHIGAIPSFISRLIERDPMFNELRHATMLEF
jgi:hypothetical protein